MSRSYRFWRRLVRWWFTLRSRRIRLLGGEKLPLTGPTLLAVNHPASLVDALILVAAFDRPVSCLLAEKLLRGFWRGLLARRLGVISYEIGESSGEGAPGRQALEACCDALAREAVMAVFAEQQAARSPEQSTLALTAASVALEAEARYGAGQHGVALLPVHLYSPGARSQSRELLIYLDSPLLPREHLIPGRDLPRQSRALAAILEGRLRENAFCLLPEDLKLFTSDLEEILRVNLEEDWASRANWKQKVEGFQLSAFVVEWADQVNYLNPGRLVALRESLEALREMRRRAALRQSEVEAAHRWLDSPLRRGWVWCESLLGSIVAFYGLLNHLLVLLILSWTGLLKSENEGDRRREWWNRGVVVAACYVMQVLLVAYLLGRSWAGYYAPTLPLSGLYLWRYLWLLRHRTRVAFLALLVPGQARKLSRMRQKFVAELNEALSAQAEPLEATKAFG